MADTKQVALLALKPLEEKAQDLQAEVRRLARYIAENHTPPGQRDTGWAALDEKTRRQVAEAAADLPRVEEQLASVWAQLRDREAATQARRSNWFNGLWAVIGACLGAALTKLLS